MNDALREIVERERRAKLHRQIGALERQLEYMGLPLTMWERIRIAKVKNRILRMQAELQQPMLIDIPRPGASPIGS